MKPPKRNTGHHVNIAPEHPLYMKKGGAVKTNNVAYTTEEEYKSHLLDPWSKEKAKAQSDWNIKKLNNERLNTVNNYKATNLNFDSSLMGTPKFASETTQSQVAYKEDPSKKGNIEIAAAERNRLAYIEQEKEKKANEDKVRARIRAQQELDIKNKVPGKELYNEDFLVNRDIARKQYQDKIENATNITMGIGAGALAGITAPLWGPAVMSGASAVMAAPEVSGGLNAYFGYQGIKNVPKTIEAWKDPNVSTIEAVGQTAMNAVELLPATRAILKNKNITNYAKDFFAAKGPPKFENVFRGQPENFTKKGQFNPNLSAEQNTYTGGWYDANKKNTMDYINGQQVKDPNAVQEILTGRLPKKTLKSISGHNLPEEAKLMSYGKGDYKSWKEVADAGHITNFEAKVMQKVEQNPQLAKQMADGTYACLLYTSPSPRDRQKSRMPSSA